MAQTLNLQQCEFRYARPEEVPDVIAMRSQAYQGTGKFERTGLLTDQYDQIAEHLTAFYQGEPIASMRLMFHQDTDEWEQDRFFTWSDLLPLRSQVVEISRTCVKHEFRHTGIAQHLMKQAVYHGLKRGRFWIIASATAKLMPIYEQIGAQRMPITFSHEDLEMVEHTVFLGDLCAALGGRQKLLLWLFFWQDIAKQAYQENILPLESKSDWLRFKILCGLGYMLYPVISMIKKKVSLERRK